MMFCIMAEQSGTHTNCTFFKNCSCPNRCKVGAPCILICNCLMISDD